MLRRPPSITMRHVDAKQPSFSYDDTPDAQRMFPSGYVAGRPCSHRFYVDHQWQYSFLAQCTIPVVDAVITPQPPSYSDILDLDSKIRNFDVPPSLQMIDNEGVAPNHPLAMQQGMTACTRETSAYYNPLGSFEALAQATNITLLQRCCSCTRAISRKR